ncbi:MAG: hypothetical protein AAFX93_17085 [Verrucomicrobiota bacterium]
MKTKFERKPSRLIWLCLAPIALCGADYDDASQAAYMDGFDRLDDGSTQVDGLGGWVFDEGALSNGYNIGIDSSATSRRAEHIDTDGTAFKMHDRNGRFLELFRFIDPSGLAVEEALSIEVIINGEMGFQGLDLRDEANETIFNLNGGAGPYEVSQAAAGNGALDIEFNERAVFCLEFFQVTESVGHWIILQRGRHGVLARGSYKGQARSLRLYAGEQGMHDSNALFFNRLQIH